MPNTLNPVLFFIGGENGPSHVAGTPVFNPSIGEVIAE